MRDVLADPIQTTTPDGTTVTAAETIREEHRHVVDLLESRMREALERGTRDDLNALVALLEGELLGHMRAEQRHLYPLMDDLIRAHGRATATMELEHETIEAHVRQIAIAVERVRAASARQERTEAKRALRDALLRFEPLLRVHLQAEERVYLPLVETHLSRAEQRRLLALMRSEGPAPGDAETLDVRAIPHRARHEYIFEVFARLPVGAALVLTNDHDPRPLSYQFAAEHPGTFTWEYLDRGPVWRVRIGRVAPG